jgi:hypothetical protein
VYLWHRSVDGAHYGENREAVSLRAAQTGQATR